MICPIVTLPSVSRKHHKRTVTMVYVLLIRTIAHLHHCQTMARQTRGEIILLLGSRECAV